MPEHVAGSPSRPRMRHRRPAPWPCGRSPARGSRRRVRQAGCRVPGRMESKARPWSVVDGGRRGRRRAPSTGAARSRAGPSRRRRRRGSRRRAACRRCRRRGRARGCRSMDDLQLTGGGESAGRMTDRGGQVAEPGQAAQEDVAHQRAGGEDLVVGQLVADGPPVAMGLHQPDGRASRRDAGRPRSGSCRAHARAR